MSSARYRLRQMARSNRTGSPTSRVVRATYQRRMESIPCRLQKLYLPFSRRRRDDHLRATYSRTLLCSALLRSAPLCSDTRTNSVHGTHIYTYKYVCYYETRTRVGKGEDVPFEKLHCTLHQTSICAHPNS